MRAVRLLMLALLALSSPVEARAQTSPAARAAWGFDRSDLTPDPRVRFGVLPIGLRYALMRGTAPPGGLSVRLHVAAGAGVEGPREAGFMHLIEHLVFAESANLPPLALPLMLRQAGLRRLADFNAYTSADETAYRLDLSRADARARTAALTVMREVATGLVFTPRAVRAARRAVVGEIRAGDASREKLVAAQTEFLFPGSRPTPVAGSERSVARASGRALRRLYERHYVPARTTLVIVGDVDPVTFEGEIATAFSGWTRQAAAEPAPAEAVFVRGDAVQTYVDRDAPTAVMIATVSPRAGSDAGRTRDAAFLEHLGSRMLGRRLADAAAAGGAPIVGPTASAYDQPGVARVARIDLPAKDRDWRGALAAGARTLRRALAQGFSPAEFDTEIASSRRALAADAAPRTDAATADAIADAAGRRLLFTAPADAAANDAYLAGLRLADVNAAFRALWANAAPMIFVSHDRPVASAAVAAAWREANVAHP